MNLYGPNDFVRLDGSKGVREDEYGRTPCKKDYARLLHAPSFRRLQGKTQLYPGAESDFFRNRLTHSLEVAQIASGIASKLNHVDLISYSPEQKIEVELVEFAALAHDLGHPPFGHNGEKVLDALMSCYGGFEGNAQSFRILTVVERKLVDVGGVESTQYGLNLTYRTLASVLKYDSEIPAKREPGSRVHKGYYSTERDLVARIKNAVAPGYTSGPFKTIECSIMDIADDIAYSTYDLEDSLHAGFVTPLTLIDSLNRNEVVRDAVFLKTNDALSREGYELLTDSSELFARAVELFDLSRPLDGAGSNTALGRLAAFREEQALCSFGPNRHSFTAQRVGDLINATEIVLNTGFPQLSGVRLRRDALIGVELFKHLTYELVIRSPRLAVVEFRGKAFVSQLFTALAESPRALLPNDWRDRYDEARSAGDAHVMRVVCDYIAGMTDRYAAELHGRLFAEGPSVFKPL